MRYRILRRLGKGGMGEVFLAKDLSLDRSVALKFVSGNLEADPVARRRFHSEAKAAAAIDHPFIAKVYSMGQQDGRDFIAMEYVEGATLTSELKKGPIPLDRALQLALEMAEALQEAHKRRIVHRDLKPSNVMLTTQGHVKILDFGLAKKLRQTFSGSEEPTALTAEVTEAGTLAGTVSYMAPEQLRGGRADKRSDLFALGVLIYEMVAGKHPFRKPNVIETVASILREDPEPLSGLGKSISKGFSSVISKMMEKSLEERYNSADELLSAFHRLAERPSESVFEPAPASQAIAVLPFDDLSSQGDQQYFCDGLAEELIDSLTQLEGIAVIARSSAFRFRGSGLPIQDIGKCLGVSSVITGSVRKAANRLRITTQLIDTSNGHHLWSGKYDCGLDDVFEIQDSISRLVISKLRGTVLNTPVTAANVSPRSSSAYELYLKGRFYWNKRTEEGLTKSTVMFRRALEEDPAYTLAYAGLADAYVTSCVYGIAAPSDLMPLAKKAASEALKIVPCMVEALVSKGSVRSLYEWDWDANLDFRQAVDGSPGYALARHWYATNYLMPLGRFSEARFQLEQAWRLDPLSPSIGATIGLLYYLERRYDQAVQSCQKVLETDPHFGLAHYFLGLVYLEQAEADSCLAELSQAAQLVGYSSETEAALALAHAHFGNSEAAEAHLDKLTERARGGYVSPVLFSQIQAALGNRDKAFRLLDEAVRARATDLIWLKVKPIFASFHNDARFEELCEQIGFPPR